jgi:hypothetical protein
VYVCSSIKDNPVSSRGFRRVAKNGIDLIFWGTWLHCSTSVVVRCGYLVSRAIQGIGAIFRKDVGGVDGGNDD